MISFVGRKKFQECATKSFRAAFFKDRSALHFSFSFSLTEFWFPRSALHIYFLVNNEICTTGTRRVDCTRATTNFTIKICQGFCCKSWVQSNCAKQRTSTSTRRNAPKHTRFTPNFWRWLDRTKLKNQWSTANCAAKG